MGISGISTGFPVLSRSSGQVAHVLRTRSPLGLHQYCYRMDLVRLACVKHAASVRPEPGSNSPSRSQCLPEEALKSESRHSETLFPEGQLALSTDVVRSQCIDLLLCSHARRRDCPHWFLAISVPFSRGVRGTGGASQKGREPMCLLARVTAQAPHFLCTLRGGYRRQSSRSVYERPCESVNRAGTRTDCPPRPTARVGPRPAPPTAPRAVPGPVPRVVACRHRRS